MTSIEPSIERGIEYRLSKLQRWLNYRFHDESLLEQAITHQCEAPSEYPRGYQRLEFVGDSVINMVLSCYLYERYLELEEGRMTQLRTALVSNHSMVALGKNLHALLHHHLPGQQLPQNYLADMIEAMVAAVYYDGGFDSARACVLHLYRQKLNHLNPQSTDLDAKTQLQIVQQKQGSALPRYVLIQRQVHDNREVFEVRCELEHLSAQAMGSSIKRAEQAAARLVLKQIRTDCLET